jgi:hypothetical protein
MKEMPAAANEKEDVEDNNESEEKEEKKEAEKGSVDEAVEEADYF